MSVSLGGSIFSRLLSLWRSLKGETVTFVDAVTNPVPQDDCATLEESTDLVKLSHNSVLTQTDSTDVAGTEDDFPTGLSRATTNDTVENNEFVLLVEDDQSQLEESAQLLENACSQFRTDVPLEDLLHISVGLHKNLEDRAEQICSVVSENGMKLESEKVKLPDTIPEAVHQGCAKEKALELKRGNLRRSQRRLYPTPRLDEDRPTKVSKKDEPTDLKELDLSRETRQLLDLDSPIKPRFNQGR
ncbi:hypothetical protein BgAZ_403270 [Babesia gibsoni]|uniref:Uncharacterized protein n=1 Tax=Babesia gibsoni TaxID=33632 RepID=A0AAD8LIN9_BABGI|nr:hypothetical protein BgAZ_403270 [Babesia gibsoni]